MKATALKEMKGSLIHRIVASVLEVMEQAGVNASVDVTLKESTDPDTWMMSFEKKDTSLDELNGIQQKLGDNFKLSVLARNKDMVVIRLEAKNDDFVALVEKTPLS